MCNVCGNVSRSLPLYLSHYQIWALGKNIFKIRAIRKRYQVELFVWYWISCIFFQTLPDLGALEVESKEQCSEQTHHRLDQDLFQIFSTVVKFGVREVGFFVGDASKRIVFCASKTQLYTGLSGEISSW